MAFLWETQVLKTRKQLDEPVRHLAVAYTKKIFLFPNLSPI